MIRGDVAPEEFDIEYMEFFVGNKTTEHLQSARSGSDTCWLTIKSMPVQMGVVSRHGD
jgi:hypothetical protein